jgi:hypothetical protein
VVGFDRMGQSLADAVTSTLTEHGVAFDLAHGSGAQTTQTSRSTPAGA